MFKAQIFPILKDQNVKGIFYFQCVKTGSRSDDGKAVALGTSLRNNN